jgi:hypothetical protein
MSYFEDGDTLPSPFNIMPSLGLLKDIFGVGEKVKTCSIKVFEQTVYIFCLPTGVFLLAKVTRQGPRASRQSCATFD